VSHQYAFFASLVTGTVLLCMAPAGRAVLAAAVYAASLSAVFGVSALYHRVTWAPRGYRWMKRLDHAMIFLLIAGTFTPFGVLVLSGALAAVILTVVWGGAAAGIVLKLAWIDAPRWLSAALYVALGWVGVAAVPELLVRMGWLATGLLVLGGLLYSAGALVYAFRRPDPAPAVFGYHEIFHALVIAAALAQYAVVAFFVFPAR
jgi:hemolysin III